MNDDELDRQRIAAAGDDALDALVGEMAARALAPYRVATQMLADPDAQAADNAAFVLGQADELALGPLSEGTPMSARDLAWAVESVVATEQALRRGVLEWLEPQLGDETPLAAPADAPPSPGPKKPPKRVCDAAYLAVLRLLRFTASEVDPAMDEATFCALSPSRRNAFIGGLQRTWTYRRARGPKA